MGRGETNAKKRKRQSEANSASNASLAGVSVTTPKPTAVSHSIKGRDWTVSVAIPGSIISNAQSHELRTSVVGQIARALCIFCVDEVIVFSDGNALPKHQPESTDAYTGTSDPDHFLEHLLSYLETPPPLRKLLFPEHPNLSTADTLPSLDSPHHLKPDEWCGFREGVTMEGADKHGTFVEAGLHVPCKVPGVQIPENTRVTLKFEESAEIAAKTEDVTTIIAEAVGPDEPREEGGYYWGYKVRRASCLSDVFTECGYDGGYDVSIGTSKGGDELETVYDAKDKVGKFKHLLIVFGGVDGLEVAVKNDVELQKLGVTVAKEVFDHWVNVCDGQGSRTIRTEEAVWIGLMGLRRLVMNNA